MGKLLRKAAELVGVAIFLTMFGAFLVQVFMRYVLNRPLGWTDELSLVMYVWAIFWAAALMTSEREHVALDLVYVALPDRGKRVVAVLGTLLLAGLFAGGDPRHRRLRPLHGPRADAGPRAPLRPGLRALSAVPGGGRPPVARPAAATPGTQVAGGTLSGAFLLLLAVFFGGVVLRVPIGPAMLAAGIAYLLSSGQDVGLAAEQILNGLFNSFVLLAVPLFIFAASIMNAGTISERLFAFAHALVGRFRGGLAHVNVLASMIFSGMSGSAIADAAGPSILEIKTMTEGGRYPPGSRPPSRPPPPPSARSSRPRSRWFSTPWSPAPRSAPCSWAAWSPAC